MKKLIALITTLALLLCGVALAEETEAQPALEIHLAENPTTGYTWSLTQSAENVLALIGDDYTADAAAEQRVGVGGVRCFAFEAVGEGKVTLTFDLQRSSDAKPAETRTFTYTVNADGMAVLEETSVPTVMVELENIVTEGYEWVILQEGEGELCCVENITITDSELTGVPSVEKWTFAALRPGDVTVTFTFTQPLVEGAEPVDMLELTYAVAEDGDIDIYEE